MAKKAIKEVAVPIEKISGKIYLIRGQKVILDRDLADLYEVETKQLKRAVRRNIDRFPRDFMFELTKSELENWRYQFGTSKGETKGLRYKPMAFTEQGVAMLSSVLRSKRAIHVNIQIMRAFNPFSIFLAAFSVFVLALFNIPDFLFWLCILMDERFYCLKYYLKLFVVFTFHDSNFSL